MSISQLGPGISNSGTVQNTSIDNTAIGANTPSTASFTTTSAVNEIVTTVSATTEYVSTLNCNKFVAPVAIISAAGTTQGAATLININTGINRLQGVTDGSATGFLLPAAASNVGTEQTLVYEGAVSANLWPNSGCKINALANNAAFALAANTQYYVVYYAASAYSVK